ncbi:hypothetical protein [EBPR siphovirus 2]|nr:hypothetical protein [EBPR siphovirus 2]
MHYKFRSMSTHALNEGAANMTVNVDSESFEAMAGTASEVAQTRNPLRAKKLNGMYGRHRPTPAPTEYPRDHNGNVPVTLPKLRFMRELPW